MKNHKKLFIFLLIIVAIAGFFYIYSAIKMEKTYAFFKPLDVLQNFENLPEVKAAAEYGKKTIDKVGEKIKNQFNKGAETVSDKVSETVSEKTEGFKDKAFNFVKESMNNGLDAVGGLLGVKEELIFKNSTSTINSKCE